MAKWAIGKQLITNRNTNTFDYYKYSTVQHYFNAIDGAYQALCGARYDAVTRGNGKKRKCRTCEAKLESPGLDIVIINMPAKAIAGFCEKGDCIK